MLKAKLTNADNTKSTFVLGLDAENIKRLLAGAPIMVQLSDFGGIDNVLIMAGETLQEMTDTLSDKFGAPRRIVSEPNRTLQ